MHHIIDNAALFSPVQLSMEDALRVDSEARADRYGAMVGLFLVPSSRLTELALATKAPPQLAVVLDRHIEIALKLIDEFPTLPIVAIETPRGVDATRGDMLEMLLDWSRRNGERATIYCEVVAAGTPLSRIDDAIERIATLRRNKTNFAAKMHTGGTIFRSVPDIEIIAHTFEECARFNVPLKATGGLHNPIRRTLDNVTVHGFLNLLLAAAIAVRDSDAHDSIVAALEEEDPQAFRLDSDSLLWRERRFGAATLAGMRIELMNSFGSGKLDEPLVALRELSLLE